MHFAIPGSCAVFTAAVVLLLLNACTSNSSRVERPITVEASTAKPPGLPKAVPAPAPTPQEAREVVARLFGEDVVVAGGDTPTVLAGDFNGDDSTDLAVAVKPAPNKLGEINAELANWTVQNPHRSYVPPKDKSVVVLPPPPKPEKVKAGENLLVIIHGHGRQGWRDSLARQVYLLKDAMGPHLGLAKPSEKLIKDFGMFSSSRDVIAEQFDGKRGVIYWTGAAYAWHAEPRCAATSRYYPNAK
jgi:hypothetical protein